MLELDGRLASLQVTFLIELVHGGRLLLRIVETPLNGGLVPCLDKSRRLRELRADLRRVILQPLVAAPRLERCGIAGRVLRIMAHLLGLLLLPGRVEACPHILVCPHSWKGGLLAEDVREAVTWLHHHRVAALDRSFGVFLSEHSQLIDFR